MDNDNFVLEEIHPADPSATHPNNVVWIELMEDSDGDRADEIIIAESPPHSMLNNQGHTHFSVVEGSSSSSGNGIFRSLESDAFSRPSLWTIQDEGIVVCQMCQFTVPLQFAHPGPGPFCTCMFCQPCLTNYIDNQLNEIIKLLQSNGLQSAMTASDCILCPTSSCMSTFPAINCREASPEAFHRWEEAMSSALFSEPSLNCQTCGGPRKPEDQAEFTCEGCRKSTEEVPAKQCKFCEENIEGLHEDLSSVSAAKLKREVNKTRADSKWCVEKSDLEAVMKLVQLVCRSKSCQSLLEQSCSKLHNCGHYCVGVREENKCLPCLHDTCQNPNYRIPNSLKSELPSADDMCPICQVDALQSLPCIQLSCGHILHCECAKQKISSGYPGPEISFNFLNCPLCPTPMDHPSLLRIMQAKIDLKKKVELKAIERLAADGSGSKAGDSSEELLKIALGKYRFYECSLCDNPYFGGEKRCEADPPAADMALDGELARNEDSGNLICGGCSLTVVKECVGSHGKDYVEFKCRFCCSPATFFCYGTTHFCTTCHNSCPDLYKTKLSDCQGGFGCPLKLKSHPPNGQEFCLGCGICRAASYRN